MRKDQGNLADLPTISVVIAAFATERWDSLRQAVASVRAQAVQVLETIVVVDHNSDLLRRAQRELRGAVVIPNVGSPGACGTHDSGVAISRGQMVAFIDDDAIGGFRKDFGKVGRCSRPEDTDLCLRAAAARPGGTWVYEGAGVVGHRVPTERATVGYFLRRCHLEGSGKAALAALNGARESTSAERLYTRRALPAGVARGLRDTARGDVSGVRQMVPPVGRDPQEGRPAA